LHSTLAGRSQGRFHGLLGAHCWGSAQGQNPAARAASKRVQSRKRRRRRWLQSYREVERLARLHPQHLWVSVTDREGDIYEVLQRSHWARGSAPVCWFGPGTIAPSWIIRDKRSSNTPAGLSQRAFMSRSVPEIEGRAAREATLSISCRAPWVGASALSEKEPAITLWWSWPARLARQTGGADSVALADRPSRRTPSRCHRASPMVCQALVDRRVSPSSQKADCQVEARQLRTRERLQRALAIDMVVAWENYGP